MNGIVVLGFEEEGFDLKGMEGFFALEDVSKLWKFCAFVCLPFEL